jgi:hypothetical protein
MYAEACTEGGRTPTSTAIEAALRDGIVAWSQFNDRVDPAPYLESLDSMYSAIVRLPEVGPETVDQTRVVMVLAHRGDEDAKALVAELHSRAASSRKRETCQYLTMALTNYTVDVRTKEHFVRAGELVIEAGDLVQDVEVCDYLLQATTNLLRMDGDRVDPNVKEALFKTAVEILLDKGGANRGSTGIVDVIGVRLTQQIQQGQLAEAAESAKTLEAAAARRELSDSVDLTVRTVATGTLSRASLDMISLHRVLELLEPFLPRIDAQTAWTIGSAWFSLIQQGEDKKGELRDALRRLARDHTDLQVLADHVQ